MELVSSVKYASRIFTIVSFMDALYLFYQSTGHNSKEPGRWFPAAGVWGGEETPYTKVPVTTLWPDWESWIPDGWIIKSALRISKDKIILDPYYNKDRYDYPQLGREVEFIANALDGKGYELLKELSGNHTDHTNTSINEEGVNTWLRGISEDFRGGTHV